MKRSGFTLIELLVVIAIISILAAIAVPNIAKYLERARMTKAVAEISNIDLALIKMLTDAGKKDFTQFFDNGKMWPNTTEPANSTEMIRALDLYREIFYRLLRKGRGATDLDGTSTISTSDETTLTLPKLKQDVAARLGDTYMEFGKDPWGSQYYFYPGPRRGPMMFRSYIRHSASTEDNPEVFFYNRDRGSLGSIAPNRDLPGNPSPDITTAPNGLPGFPASRDITTYVWSIGQNLENDQAIGEIYDNGVSLVEPLYQGGGDDINNWDKESGWSGFYGR